MGAIVDGGVRLITPIPLSDSRGMIAGDAGADVARIQQWRPVAWRAEQYGVRPTSEALTIADACSERPPIGS